MAYLMRVWETLWCPNNSHQICLRIHTRICMNHHMASTFSRHWMMMLIIRFSLYSAWPHRNLTILVHHRWWRRWLLASSPADWRRQPCRPLITWLSTPSNRIWNNTTLCSPKQQVWLRTVLCGGWCRRMALRNVRVVWQKRRYENESF